MLVLDGAVYQYTANALELAPSGGGGGAGGSTTVNVVPIVSEGPERAVSDHPLPLYYKEQVLLAVLVSPTVDLESKTLRLIFRWEGAPNAPFALENADIDRVESTFSFVPPTTISNRLGLYHWALRDTEDNAVLAKGLLLNSDAPDVDV